MFFKNLKFVITPNRTKLIGIVILKIITMFFQYSLSYLLGFCISSVGKELYESLFAVISYFCCLIITIVLGYFIDKIIVSETNKSVLNIRNQLLDKLEKTDVRYMSKYKQGQLQYQCFNQVDELCNDSWISLIKLIEIIMSIIIVFAYTININSTYLIVFFIVVPLCASISLKVANICLKTAETKHKYNENHQSILAETVKNISEIKKMSAEKYFEERLFDSLDLSTEGENKHRKSILKYQFVEKILVLISYSIIFGLSIWLSYLEKIEIGYLITMLNFGGLIFLKVSEVNYLKDMYYNNKIIISNIKKIFDLPKIENGKTLISNSSGVVQNIIELENVEIEYEGKINKLTYNIEIRYGEHIAIIGKSGGGKTTLFRILTRLMSCTEGRVAVLGISIKDWDVSELRKRVCYIPQTPFLFDGTVIDNILWGNECIEQEYVIDVLKRAQLEDIIYEKNGNFKKIIEGGKNLSGGEQQRIMLIRALLRNADIYLFDESFSKLDTETRTSMLNYVKTILRTKTILFVTHENDMKEFVDRTIII